ncbi:DNA-binding protein [Streptomyces sp. Ru71]|uniref:DNA-binding protein n=1 Tax=Streptomyces sp. Ru71 TaxID=2080746 RepID=UPI000CDD7424|nr:DNA-binding protein [Streptomyces sp. Ru71]POX55402.1 DNA-binding protein [Streptomyces sp. Ru71]
MDTQHFSAPPCAQPLNRRGITHINSRHTERFTVIGNHLAQHRELSLTAIGLAAHIQSLPAGAPVGIKALAARFPEGETRIAAALRELEAHGYLARIRERLPNGRVVTYTVSYNQPTAERAAPRREARPTPPPQPPPAPVSEAPPAPPPPPLPEPQAPDLDRHRAATAVLATLHHHDPRLLLSERAVRQLAPAVAAWLERGAHPDAVRHALTANLPREPLRNPAALLAHRLTDLLPPPPPATPPPADRPAPPLPIHNCEGCERGIRTPRPGGYCRDCREERLRQAAAA